MAHILELSDCLLFLWNVILAAKGVQSVIDVSSDFVGGGIVPDDGQEVQGV